MSLFSMKIVKLSSFISVIHMEEGALALTSHIALVYLPNSLMLRIKFGCDSSPLYFHTLEHTQWACFLRACAVSEIYATLHWFWSKKQPGPKPKGYRGNVCHWLASPHLIVEVVGGPKNFPDLRHECCESSKVTRGCSK